jgi:hypothetical protein
MIGMKRSKGFPFPEFIQGVVRSSIKIKPIAEIRKVEKRRKCFFKAFL